MLKFAIDRSKKMCIIKNSIREAHRQRIKGEAIDPRREIDTGKEITSAGNDRIAQKLHFSCPRIIFDTPHTFS